MATSIRYLIFYLLVPTLLFAVLKHYFFIIRGFVDIDYLAVGALAPWVGGWITGVLFSLAFLFDILLAFAPAFHFKAGGFAESVANVVDIQASFVAIITLLILASTALYAAITVRLTRPGRSRWLPSLVMAGSIPLLMFADGVSTGNALMKGDNAVIPLNLATSSGFEVLRSGYRWLRYKPDAGPARQIAAATDALRNSIESGQSLPRNILVVVSESLGVFKDPSANRLANSALDNPALLEKFQVVQGTVPFFYSTVPGELRELCGVLKPTIDPELAELPLTECLPQRLKQLGYYTVAAHGFSGNFFNRKRWYPGLGFDESLFGRDIDAAAGELSRCGVAFSGVCDATVMRVLREGMLARSAERNFVYWLTLNAHTPFPEPTSAYGRVDCAQSPVSASNDAVCKLIGLYHVVLASVVDTVLDQRLNDTGVIVVGDHPPPFVTQENRALFDGENVPYVILWPKERPLNARPVAMPAAITGGERSSES